MFRPFHAVCFALALAAASWPVAAVGLEGSVVRIVNYSQRNSWSSPWDATKAVESSGSGFVIEGGLVLTNAHVVSDSRLLLIHLADDPAPHEAEVLHVAHDCDLALVRPLAERVLDAVVPLALGDLPRLGSFVETLGYPTGGTRISSTRGVVSRIEQQLYVHSGADAHLAVQTDAAINPGSSGGPVVQDGRVVGVSFQANLELQSVGFFIPSEVISRFLKDVEDGHYDGYPELGADTANMDHPALRARVGLAEGETGAHVFRVYRGSSADGTLLPGDVLLAVNGRPVANDGSVLDDHGRIPYGLLVDRLFIGDTVTLRVLRDGARFDLKIPLLRSPFFESRRHVYDVRPRYFVYGGLVFVPLSLETLKTYGNDWPREAPKTLLAEFYHRVLVQPELQLQERIVLLRRLEHPVNAEMAWFRDEIVAHVNGHEITSLDALIDAFEQHTGEHHLIEFTYAGRFGVMDRRATEVANEGILERYGVHKDRYP